MYDGRESDAYWQKHRYDPGHDLEAAAFLCRAHAAGADLPADVQHGGLHCGRQLCKLAGAGRRGHHRPLLNTLLGFFNGFSTGATVVIARAYGARDRKSVHEACHTTILTIFLMAIPVYGLGMYLTPYSGADENARG